MKRLLLGLICLSSSIALAAKAPVEAASANINKGNIEVGGGFHWAQDNGTGSSSSYYSIDPQAEYFIADSFSVGGRLSYSAQNGTYGYSSVAVGPSLTLYFYQQGEMAFYFAQSFLFVKPSFSTTTDTTGATSLGVKFFVVPTVAFGIGLTTGYPVGNNSNSLSTTRLGGSFSFYF